MKETDPQIPELVSKIIQQAQDGQHTEFHLINYWSEYWYFLQLKKSVSCVLKILRNCSNSILNTYCREIQSGAVDFRKLLAYKQFVDITGYYSEELNILQQMILEYENYLTLDKLIPALFGKQRGV